jgi:squalene-hopene/tetraprenyl-beta-curcumene cyclase
MKSKHLTLIVAAAILAGPVGAAELPSKSDISVLTELDRAQELGMKFLLSKQMENGSWNMHPAMTGLAISSMLRSGKPLTIEQKEAVDRGVKFILTCVKPTGAIYGGGESDRYPNYSTAICTMALLATGNDEYTPIIKKARAFLLDSQFEEGDKVMVPQADGTEKEVVITKDDPGYGGIGYGKRKRPDLSNMQWAVEAIRLTESLETKANNDNQSDAVSKLHWNKAVEFLTRCQNLPGTNDQAWAVNARGEDVGGFVYMPGLSFADEEAPADPKAPLRSYGSMTYAGLKSMIYAELKKDDPRVQAAIKWLQHNYTLEENPGMGQQGLYYYFHTFAKSLTAYGEDTITTADGKQHDWRYELMKKFISLQKTDLEKGIGYWQNDNNRWWENDPVLCTAYSLLAIEVLKKRQYP